MTVEIYVYGTGCGAGDLIDQALPPERVSAFVEKDAGGSFLGRPVISLEELAERDFDLLIVASRRAEQVERDCRDLGLDPEKLLFLKNRLVPTDRNRSYKLARAALGDAWVDRLIESERLIRVPLWTEKERIAGEGADSDYVRLKSLEALCRRLEGVAGAAAELGVYRGDFARWLNELLPDRELYLFDTFSGFDEKEAEGEAAGLVAAHRNANAAGILARLPHPELARLRPGLFPRTALGLEGERFALVSLDADLEESTLLGLRWFYPRLSEGGFLLLHDWDNPRLPGVKRALSRFEKELGRRLAGVPLCDLCGTLVLPG